MLSFFSASKHGVDGHDCILNDPDCISSLDESAIDCTFGRSQRVFTAVGERNVETQAIKS